MAENETIIKLNIAYEYPVKWDMRRIMRDLVQNYYDSVGMKNFSKAVDYRYFREQSAYTVILDTNENPFGYEWLIYIGASTKTGKSQYIGEYGEGFKIAVLCLYRDFNVEFIMESQDWQLEPCCYTEIIDGTEHRMFGYKKRPRIDDGHTRLTLTGIKDNFDNKTVLDEALLDFYYPDNPLFGKKIYANKKIGIYHRSDMPVPCHDEGKCDIKGILYSKYLARGRLSIPFIICLNELKETHYEYSRLFKNTDGRERNTFSDRRTIEIISTESKYFPSGASYKLLVLLKEYWNRLPDNLYDAYSLYYFVCQLVRNVSKNSRTKKKFMEEYNNLVYIERPTPDSKHKRLIDQTKKWWAECGDSDKRMVIPVFRLLGAENLVPIYEETQKKSFIRPSELEKSRYENVMLLASIVVGVDSDSGFPELLIYEGKSDYYNPDQYMKKIYKSHSGNGFPSEKFKVEAVVMTHDDFKDDSFDKTFVKAIDILLHRYGTSRSEKVNSQLTTAGSSILKYEKTIGKMKDKWKEAI